MTTQQGAASLTVCVLSWNGREHLEICLDALADQQEPGCAWEVLVLDNGSQDGTIDWLEAHWAGRRLGDRLQGRLRWLSERRNQGFCEGNNLLARAASGEHLVLLNNDTRPERDWLKALSSALAAAPADVAAVGGRIVDWSGQKVDFVEGMMTFDGHAFQRDFGRPLEEVAIPSAGAEQLFACGGNMIVRKKSFERVGCFDSSYFAYLEDVDLGWRLWSAGERVLFEPSAVVRHRSMASSNALGTFDRGLLFERNALRTVLKNFDQEHWRLLAPAILMTFLHRTQSMLVQNNEGGESVLKDPYSQSPPESTSCQRNGAAVPAKPSLRQKWSAWGTRDLARRGLRKLFENLATKLRRPGDPGMHPSLPGSGAATELERLIHNADGISLGDPRTMAQLRAFSHFTRNLDQAMAQRALAQARRTRPDREIFDRFPLYLVPTYPGDAELFASLGFRSWLPEQPALVERTLEDLMA